MSDAYEPLNRAGFSEGPMVKFSLLFSLHDVEWEVLVDNGHSNLVNLSTPPNV